MRLRFFWPVLLAGALAPSALGAQLPGPKPYDWDGHRSEIAATALRQSAAVLEEWQTAWEAGDHDRVLGLYDLGAQIALPDGAVVRGPVYMRPALRELLPGEPLEVSLFISDFTAFSQLAHLIGDLLYRYRDADGNEVVRTGAHMTLLERQKGEWRIRAQAFVLRPAPEPTR